MLSLRRNSFAAAVVSEKGEKLVQLLEAFPVAVDFAVDLVDELKLRRECLSRC